MGPGITGCEQAPYMPAACTLLRAVGQFCAADMPVVHAAQGLAGAGRGTHLWRLYSFQLWG